MSLKFVFVSLIIIISIQITGCSAFRRANFSPAGNSRVTVGEVEVRKSLEYIGDTIEDTLIVSADENGNGIISAGKGKLEIIPLILDNDSRTEVIAILKKLSKWGDTAKQEKVEITKTVDSVSTSTGIFGGSTLVHIEFLSSPGGNTWGGKMEFCYIGSKVLGPSKPIGFNYDPCDRKTAVYINPSSTSQLISLLENIPQSVNKAKQTESKDALFN